MEMHFLSEEPRHFGRVFFPLCWLTGVIHGVGVHNSNLHQVLLRTGAMDFIHVSQQNCDNTCDTTGKHKG